ncbi:TRAP transporter substrate-binding protein [Lutimaribacter sp. EGI FJ00015]|uniref:TRAP transporter substrate-binding protein n=1 Tax=Lutimaribacter degradans TaxID=2945989 RepID=A0ACC5ZY47_9RHOB|nr:TRAP transporter substrate-binding protein [Lutimaribacter sp. EGI FJ00013]MCM2562962.1 TRAP transporter substrate-binding protein [Lutimaribacter sp. EGI FJ00013]MCO0614130.1 TRAP transporter substrate-binding protein [Lutimaribacter sp. EGI FJ00015]MCO0636107.1 TRAP transporter substrate-binding protein [Lutimaribacter sp. EGI FJ00014]
MKTFTKFKTLAAVSAAVFTLGQPGAVSAQTSWDMATPYPDAEFHTRNIVQFAEEISDATAGELSITVHSGSSLFKHPEIKRAVQNQFVPIGEVLMANLFNEDPIFGADNIPFIASNYEDAKALWDAQRPLVEAKLAEDGIRLLYAVPWPGQGFYTNKELTSGSDLEGMRFRTYNATTARMAELLGASPTTIEAVEIPQAFSTGIVDAMVTSGATGVRTKAWDFTTEFYDLQAWLPKNMIIVNESAFSDLPEDQQKAILDAAAAAETRGWEMSQTVSTESVNELSENMTVHQPSAELSADLGTVGETMAAEWAESVGDEGKTILEALD